MTDEERDKLRKHAEANIKLQLYQQPAFPFYQSIGVKELFYPVQSDEDFVGFLHIWWNKDKPSGIVKGGKEAKGFWETTWYDKEEDKPHKKDKIEINYHKLQIIANQEEHKRLEVMTLRRNQEEKLQRLTAPPGILKKYLS